MFRANLSLSANRNGSILNRRMVHQRFLKSNTVAKGCTKNEIHHLKNNSKKWILLRNFPSLLKRNLQNRWSPNFLYPASSTTWNRILTMTKKSVTTEPSFLLNQQLSLFLIQCKFLWPRKLAVNCLKSQQEICRSVASPGEFSTSKIKLSRIFLTRWRISSNYWVFRSRTRMPTKTSPKGRWFTASHIKDPEIDIACPNTDGKSPDWQIYWFFRKNSIKNLFEAKFLDM